MRELHVQAITDAVAALCIHSNCHLPGDVKAALQAAQTAEQSDLGRQVLADLLENSAIAAREAIPLCQDTGFAVVFLDIGQDVHLTGGDLEAAVNEGVRRGYTEGYLRKSIVADPLFTRTNTGDNTPAVLHTRIVPGDRVTVTVAPKGGGSENMSALGMLKPAQGVAGVKQFVVDAVRRAGGNPCPPVIVGVGVGGTAEKCMALAKHALLRPLDEENPDEKLSALEAELLREINALNIGPQGFGGSQTALAVHIETYPCHIASLPVAVNLQCHAARHETVTL